MFAYSPISNTLACAYYKKEHLLPISKILIARACENTYNSNLESAINQEIGLQISIPQLITIPAGRIVLIALPFMHQPFPRLLSSSDRYLPSPPLPISIHLCGSTLCTSGLQAASQPLLALATPLLPLSSQSSTQATSPTLNWKTW
jgi:hypothetical protein